MNRVKINTCVERARGLIAVCSLFLLMSSTNAFAQWRQAGLAPEKQAAAQEWEAKTVAKMLKLSKETTDQLVAAYQAARENYGTAMEGLRNSQEGDRAARFQKYQQLGETEKKKLENALEKFLTKEQTQKAIASLGTFSRRWDQYVDTLAGLELEEEKMYKALDQVTTYVAESSKAMQEDATRSNWSARRTILQEHKATLDAALKSILSEKQIATWTEATASRRR